MSSILGYLHLWKSPYAPCIWVHLNPYVMILIYILNYALYYTIVDPQHIIILSILGKLL